MDLRDLQRESWQCAEEKGHHTTLNGVSSLGRREQALLALVPLYQALNNLTQDIKRHGIDKDHGANAAQLLDYVSDAVLYCGDVLEKLPEKYYVSPDNKALATALRLILVHTEVDEAIEVSLSDLDPISRLVQIGKEFADILIRMGDVAEDVGLDMNEWVRTVMAANRHRPYGYNTPLQEETQHE